MGLHGLHESILIDALPTLKVAHFSGLKPGSTQGQFSKLPEKRALHPLERANLKANAPEVKDFLRVAKPSRLAVGYARWTEFLADKSQRIRVGREVFDILPSGSPDRRLKRGEL